MKADGYLCNRTDGVVRFSSHRIWGWRMVLPYRQFKPVSVTAYYYCGLLNMQQHGLLIREGYMQDLS